jgi:hypothetical protein
MLIDFVQFADLPDFCAVLDHENDNARIRVGD